LFEVERQDNDLDWFTKERSEFGPDMKIWYSAASSIRYLCDLEKGGFPNGREAALRDLLRNGIWDKAGWDNPAVRRSLQHSSAVGAQLYRMYRDERDRVSVFWRFVKSPLTL
jgi:hypothetical protein